MDYIYVMYAFNCKQYPSFCARLSLVVLPKTCVPILWNGTWERMDGPRNSYEQLIISLLKKSILSSTGFILIC